jgi:hypothetical protein
MDYSLQSSGQLEQRYECYCYQNWTYLSSIECLIDLNLIFDAAFPPIYSYLYVYIWVYMYVCIYTYIYICINIYIYIYIYVWLVLDFWCCFSTYIFIFMYSNLHLEHENLYISLSFYVGVLMCCVDIKRYHQENIHRVYIYICIYIYL